MKKCPSCQADVEDSLLRCPPVPGSSPKEGRGEFALLDIASFAVPGVAFLLSLVAFLLGILL